MVETPSIFFCINRLVKQAIQIGAVGDHALHFDAVLRQKVGTARRSGPKWKDLEKLSCSEGWWPFLRSLHGEERVTPSKTV